MNDTHVFTCNLCEALCGLSVTVEEGRHVTSIRGDTDDVFSRGHICPKGPALGELFHDPDRLRRPVRRTASGWEPLAWDDAFELVASRLKDVQQRHGRDAVALYVGNPTVHGHRAGLGSQALSLALRTKNRFDPNSQDSNPRLFACMHVYGDALSIPVPDVERTDHLLILGANPAASNGSQMVLGDVRARMQGIRARGGSVVLVDPRRTESASWATRHCFIRPGGDAALLLAMLDVLFRERLVDERRVTAVSHGLDELRRLATRFPAERVAPAIDVSADVIRSLARDFAAAERACAYARVGVCQNEFGPLASWLVEALNVVTGNLDRPGGSMFATPAADIAPLGRLVVGNHHGRWRSRVRGLPEFLGALPSGVMAEEIETEGPGQIRALVTFAGNPVLSTPNGERLARALRTLEFSVSIDMYVNETNRLADVILPPSHVFETGNFDILMLRFPVRNVVKYSAPLVEKDPDGRDDWQILSELSFRLLAPERPRVQRALRRLTRDLPERIVDGLLRAGPYSLDLEKVRAAPHGIDLGPLVPRWNDVVRTKDKRVQLAPAPLVADVPRLEAWVSAPRATSLVLIGRRHLRGNNSWLHNVRSLVKGPDRARLMLHPDDATRLGVVDGAEVVVTSRVGEVRVRAVVTDEIMPGVASLPHGYGHASLGDTTRIAASLPGPSANTLTDEQLLEPVLGTSILNGVPITVRPA